MYMDTHIDIFSYTDIYGHRYTHTHKQWDDFVIGSRGRTCKNRTHKITSLGVSKKPTDREPESSEKERKEGRKGE